MTIHLSKDVETAINSAVLSGRFASPDDMVAALVRDYTRSHPIQSPAQSSGNGVKQDMGAIGAMQDAADELDQAMNFAAELRRQPWRISTSE